MKKYFVIILLLCICISTSAQNTTNEDNTPQADELTKAFQEALSEAAEDQKSLGTKSISPGFKTINVEFGYAKKDVKNSFESIRKKLLKSLDAPEYEGIRNQIGSSFPEPNLEFLGLKRFRIIVTKTSVEKGYQEITEYINELKTETAKSRVTINIIVNDGQKGFATFKLGSRSAITVTGLIPNIIRKSKIRYVVSKQGFHDIFGELDLRNTTPTTLECNMQEDSVTNAEVGCTQIFKNL